MSDQFHQSPRQPEIVDLPQEMRTSFLDYAMSVIVARALPDVRDGLKPVHRRILYGMSDLGVTPDKPYKKSARIVGDVMGKYHPHGDNAIYEAMVRMAQPFSYRQLLVDGHGNFGSIDGDSAAAMRYTEARMSRLTLEMLKDINKDTVDFQDNYSQEEREPVILPARFPNLLVNGASGIAVGMATNIPPHNLGETIDAVIALMENPEITITELMDHIPGPDFPTGGIVLGKSGIRKAYQTGRGRIVVRSQVEIEELSNDRERIIVTEIPYGVNKARIVERIAELARDKRVDGITYVADESNREGMRIVVDVRRDMSASVVLNNLYKYTQLQVTFGFNMLAIDHGVPKVLNLKEILEKYLTHQVEVITRRTQFDKNRAESRAHILEGLLKALDVIDQIIAIIRNADDGDQAKTELISQFEFSDRQAQAILDMRLVRLTGLEREKLVEEYDDLIELIRRLTEILSSRDRIYEIIEDELLDIKQRFDDERRTQLRMGELISLEDEDLIEEEEILIALTSNGYIKRMTEDEFQVQRRGGRGVKGIGMSDDDDIQSLISCSTHDVLLFFSDQGKAYQLKGYEVPEYGRTARGIPIINLLDLEDEEIIKAILPLEDDRLEDYTLFFVTKNGQVKRTLADAFGNIRANGLIAINLREDDSLVTVFVTEGEENIVLGSHQGSAIVFNEEDVRIMGRTAAGVRGMRLRSGDYVIGGAVLSPDDEVLVVTDKGYGKRTHADQYRVSRRGGYGVKTVDLREKSGQLAGLVTTDATEDLMIMTDQGVAIRFEIASISQTSRATLGVRMIRLDEGSFVSSIAKIDPFIDDEEVDDDAEDEDQEDEETISEE